LKTDINALETVSSSYYAKEETFTEDKGWQKVALWRSRLGRADLPIFYGQRTERAATTSLINQAYALVNITPLDTDSHVHA